MDETLAGSGGSGETRRRSVDKEPGLVTRRSAFDLDVVDQQQVRHSMIKDRKLSAVSLLAGGSDKGEEFAEKIHDTWRIPLLLGPTIGISVFLLLFFLKPEGMSESAMKVLAVAIVMAVWWMAEALPLGIVSLLPLCMYPLLQIMPSKEVAPQYASSTFWLFFGGIQLSFAIERSKLHVRIALGIMRAMGTRVALLMLGMNLACAGLSMFLSNTSTTVMLLPVAKTLVTTLGEGVGEGGGMDLKLPFMLGLAYSASGGGIGTIIGTGTNVAFAAIATDFDKTVSFSQWMIFAFPLALIIVLFIWAFFVFGYKVPFKNLPDDHPVFAKLKDITPMSQAEKAVTLVFMATVLAWMFRKVLASQLGMEKYLTDDVIAIVTTITLFILKADYGDGEGPKTLMDWPTFLKMPWELMFLFGGGLSLAAGFKETGLSLWLGQQLSVLEVLPAPLLVGSVVMAVTFLTEVTSNVATANVWLPIVGQLSVAIGRDPFFLMIPTTLAASCAFMLPVATPPNAVIFGSGWVTIREMARNGFVINCCAIVIITTYCVLLGTEIGDKCVGCSGGDDGH